MILKSQVEWALHCCAILAGLPEGRYLSTKALAEFHGLPKEYLSKALQSLSQAGLVRTTLGPSGGYRLAKAPAELTFLDIVEAVEGKAPTFVCTNIRANNPCRAPGYCESTPCAVAQSQCNGCAIHFSQKSIMSVGTLDDSKEAAISALPSLTGGASRALRTQFRTC